MTYDGYQPFPPGGGGFPPGGGGFPPGGGGFPPGGGGFPPGGGGFPPGGGGFPPGRGGFPPGGGGAGMPPGPPPRTTPRRPQGGVGTYRISAGSISGCMYQYVYVWLDNGNSFWFYPVYLSYNTIAGYRWNGYNWRYTGIDLRRIDYFECY